MPGLASYMAQYDHEHSSVWNKVFHGVGIPLIFAGIILVDPHEMDLGSSVLPRRMGISVPGSSHRR